MIKSCKLFAQNHNLDFSLSKKKQQSLLKTPCNFCYSPNKANTYQNVGLTHWKKGYTDNNVFPLCKLCYIIRNGQSKTKLLCNIERILFRIPVVPQLQYKHRKACKKTKYGMLCRSLKCTYCHSKTSLSINKVDPNHDYLPHNVQTLCWTCNRMKSNLNENTFFKHLTVLYFINTRRFHF